MPVQTHKQPLYLKLIFSLSILIVFIGCFEVLLRIVDPDLYQKNQFFPLNRDIDFPDVYKKDQHLFWRFRPNQIIDSKAFSDITYHINSDGMRGDEINKTKEGLRIIALGNSCTFGWGVRHEKIWTTLVQYQLQSQLGTPVEVINCGVPGYSSFQGKLYFENELLKYNPDIVLVMFGWNDQWTAGKGISDAEQEPPNILIITTQNLLSKLKVYQFFRKIFLSMTEKEEKISPDNMTGKRRVSRSEFENNLRSIVRTAKEHNIIPVLLVPPVASLQNYHLGSASRFHQQHKSYQDKVKTAAKYEDVTCIDEQIPFDRYNNLFTNPANDPIHFNANGHAVFAKTVVDTLLPIIERLKK